MATLELEIDGAIVVAPVRRTRRLGTLFWLAVGWLLLVFAASSMAPAQLMTSHGAAMALYWFFAVLWGTRSAALSVVAELSAAVTLSVLGWVQVAPVGSHRAAEVSP